MKKERFKELIDAANKGQAELGEDQELSDIDQDIINILNASPLPLDEDSALKLIQSVKRDFRIDRLVVVPPGYVPPIPGSSARMTVDQELLVEVSELTSAIVEIKDLLRAMYERTIEAGVSEETPAPDASGPVSD
jgi:hypothetical protein